VIIRPSGPQSSKSEDGRRRLGGGRARARDVRGVLQIYTTTSLFGVLMASIRVVYGFKSTVGVVQATARTTLVTLSTYGVRVVVCIPTLH
jgi:hypothetical protein